MSAVERASAHGNHPKVLFMSGYTGDEMVRRGIASGDYPFLQKPFTPNELAHAVSNVLAKGAP
jgi:two-component system, cell cycle sensor histidine kinase and response regulator CckA